MGASESYLAPAPFYSPTESTIPPKLSRLGKLQYSERDQILELIDQFRGLGIDHILSNPQIVVVGDEYCGKSLLLEALTGLPFRFEGQLSTRFTTQFSSSRSPKEECMVTVIPGPSRRESRNYKNLPRQFRHVCSIEEISERRISEVLDSAFTEMRTCFDETGEHNGNVALNRTRFFDDVVRIELSGPDQLNITIVELPGLPQGSTIPHEDEDRRNIRKMILRHISQPQTTILALIDATKDFSSQDVLQIAKSADEEDTSTIGVVTKLDSVPQEKEEQVIDILRNKLYKLSHGWFVMRSLKEEGTENGARTANDNFVECLLFKAGLWDNVDSIRGNCGVMALQNKLRELLYRTTCQELPILQKRLKHRLEKAQDNLAYLGPERETPLDQQDYLIEIAETYHKHVWDAFWVKSANNITSERRMDIQKSVLKSELSFLEKLNKKAQTFNFDEVLDSAREGPDSSADIYQWIRERYHEHRGFELPGLVNPKLLEVLFREQSLNWDYIIEQHLEEIENILTQALKWLYSKLVGDDLVCRRLQSDFDDFTKERFRSARVRALKLLENERQTPSTTDSVFTATLQKIKSERVSIRLRKHGFGGGKKRRLSWNAAQQIFDSDAADPEEQALFDIHDVLKAYYENALLRIKENIQNDVINPLIYSTDSPLNFFTPEAVCEYSNEKLHELTAEPDDIRHRREELNEFIEEVQRGLEKIKCTECL